MRSVEAKKMRSEPARNWSPNLETSIDGRSSFPIDRPEMTRILSSSRAGRMHWHRNQFVPLPCRPKDMEHQLEEFMPPEHKQHLIYLALYRDKVDQHQAAMAKPKSPEGQARSPSPGAEEESDPHGQARFAATTGAFERGKETSEPRRPHTAAAAHTATVKATSASGPGYLTEHAEAKRLGKLFDEWVSKQDIDAAYESVALPSPPRAEGRRVKVETSPVKARRPRFSSKSGRRTSGFSAQKPQAKSDEDEASCWADHPSVGTASSLHHRRAKEPDRRKLERLWMVMTNPKVRSASLSDKAGHENTRLLPTRIEGIKPLMLYKLYKGPWRLDI